MKSTLLIATLSMVVALPKASAATELETLRGSLAEHDQRLRHLENKVKDLENGRTNQREAPARETSATTTTDPGFYTVKPGDSIERIARRNNCSVASLTKANGLKIASIIHPGQKLKLPGMATAEAPATRPPASAQVQAAAPAAAVSGKTHKIRPGETYSSIARKYKVSVATLTAANPGVKATALRPGQEISLSSGTSTNQEIRPLVTSPATAIPKAPVTPLSSTSTIPAMAQKSPAPAPARQPVTTNNPLPAGASDMAASSQEKRIRSVTIDGEMTYAEFAAKHGTDTGRLNDLNGLDLTNATVLAKGSELYVPAQP